MDANETKSERQKFDRTFLIRLVIVLVAAAVLFTVLRPRSAEELLPVPVNELVGVLLREVQSTPGLDGGVTFGDLHSSADEPELLQNVLSVLRQRHYALTPDLFHVKRGHPSEIWVQFFTDPNDLPAVTLRVPKASNTLERDFETEYRITKADEPLYDALYRPLHDGTS